MKYAASLVLLITLVSCNYFKKPKEPKAVARVGEVFLYEEDIEHLVPKGTSKKDSIAIVRAFIDRWATQNSLPRCHSYQSAILTTASVLSSHVATNR